MVSAPERAVEGSIAAAPTEAGLPVARLNARVSAYLVDSVILIAFILVFFVLGGLELLVADSRSSGDPPDAAYYAFIAIFLAGSLLVWTLFNLALLRWRGQTAGMYVIGIRTVAEDGGRPTMGQVAVRWFGLHPLLFHPFLLPVWALFSMLIVSVTLNQIVLIVTVALAVLCLVSPVAGLVTLLTSPERRALHDRLSGTLVVHQEQR